MKFIPYVLPCFLLGGCAFSPTVDVLGSYFPAWMVCIFAGLALTAISRILLVGLHLHEHLRPRSLVYLSLLIVFTALIWLIFFKN